MRVVSVRNPHMDGVVMIPAETIFWGFCYRGYRYAQPTAKHGLSLIGIDCIYAMRVLRATFQSPLQLRGGSIAVISGYCDVYNKLSTDT
ncbi:MAG: hypothetical protein K2G49_03140, partial [Muribaculum sp.]|nr:hypothetical protein [Muribaculum sp.]